MAASSAARVRAAAALTRVLIKLNAPPPEDRAGEEADKNNSRQPAAANRARMRSGLCAPTLSTTTTVPGDRAGSRKCCRYVANTAVSVPPSTVIAGTIPARLSPGEQRGHRTPVAWHRPACPAAAGRAGAAAGHRGVRGALIDEHHLGRVHLLQVGAPLGARGLVALGGAQTFDFNGRPGRRRRPAGVNASAGAAAGSVVIARAIVASDTPRPSAAVKAAACSVKVASAATCSRAGSQACSRWVFSGLGPCRYAVGARLPVFRRRVR